MLKCQVIKLLIELTLFLLHEENKDFPENVDEVYDVQHAVTRISDILMIRLASSQ